MKKTTTRLSCPVCQAPLTPVRALGHYDAAIFLDQCPHCGGIWFDHFEFISVKKGEARRIEQLDVRKLKKTGAPAEYKRLCPHDGTLLERFLDRNFPASIDIERCPRCSGFWFDVGEFTAYKEHRKAQPPIKKLDPEFERQIDSLLRLSKNSEGIDMLGKIGHFLSTPVSGQGVPLTSTDDWRTNPAGSAATIATQVIGMLLRALVKR